MRYKITAKESKTTGFSVIAESNSPNYQYNILAVNEDDFHRINVNDTIEILITVIPAETTNA